jgi:hypothetical protein
MVSVACYLAWYMRTLTFAPDDFPESAWDKLMRLNVSFWRFPSIEPFLTLRTGQLDLLHDRRPRAPAAQGGYA